MARPLKCEQVEDLLPIASVGGLSHGEGQDLSHHLAECDSCREIGIGYAAIADALPSALEPAQPPQRLRRNLMAHVYAEHAATPAPTKRAWRRLWDRIPAGRGFTLGGGLATASAAVLVFAMAITNHPAPPLSQQTAFQVSGTTADPGANGTLTYDPARNRAVLTVQGLPALPSAPGAATSVYEVWLVPSQGDPVPASFLTLEPGGRTWTGVVLNDVSRFRTIAATIEPQGGTQHPTGTQVISGPLGPG